MGHDAPHDLTSADLALLAARGISPEEAAAQLRQLRHPPPPVRLLRAATTGDGIDQFPASRQDEATRFIDLGDQAAAAGRVLKFVPASGAATRMFKDLIGAAQGARRPSEAPAAREFFARLDEFPFAAVARAQSGIAGPPASEEEERRLLRTVLNDLRLAELPKALVPFHLAGTPRTAFEEHLLEGARYVRDARGVCRLHFTVPVEAIRDFEATLARLRPLVEGRRRGARLDVSFSTQRPSTDTLAIDGAGAPFRDADGQLLLRPSGHGALLDNLGASGGDLVVIKNIDNVLPDEASAEVVRWKRLLIGYLADLQARVFAHLSAVTGPSPSADTIASAEGFAAATFGRAVQAPDASLDARAQAVVSALHRPLRVCGVVRNEGEPGGAPFWVAGPDGRASLQIVEKAQVDLSDADQSHIFHSATHFNPVDLVCGLRGYDGSAFDLSAFVDSDTAFVTEKTADGRRLLALERPGLWNGSMAGWNTVCVEVPGSTFAPVKTVFDLLRPQHQLAQSAPPAPADAPAIEGTVLIIDDQPLNQRLLTQILGRAGLRTHAAGDWDRGQELLRAEAIDLVLLDIMLPGLDGYEILGRLLADPATRDIPVILISALDAVADKVRGMELGAADYVTKPFDPQEVLARVRSQLRIRHLASSLARSNARLLQREQAMLEELRAAAEVQKSLLPARDLSREAMAGSWVFEPSLAIGGDIFHAIPLANGSTLAYMADVSGHGVASALLTMSVAQWLASFAALRTGDAPSPGAILSQLEAEYPFERFDKYFSIVVATISPDGRQVRYSAAGHPPPLVIRRDGRMETLEAGGPIIGMGFGLPFDEETCTLDAGDRLLLYTDGVVEDLDTSGERLGTDRLAEFFAAHARDPLAEVCASLGAWLTRRRGDAPAGDDIALLAFERR